MVRLRGPPGALVGEQGRGVDDHVCLVAGQEEGWDKPIFSAHLPYLMCPGKRVRDL